MFLVLAAKYGKLLELDPALDHRGPPRVKPLALIVAIADNGVIGSGGQLPWSYAEDREHFRRTTWGHAVIMGRRTWQETGEPLEGRTNIVVTRTLALPDGVLKTSTLDEALELGWARDAEPFVIGGAGLFRAALPRVTHAFVTRIPETPEGDARFEFDPSGFRLVSSREGTRGETYLEYERDE
jgi:dihydrofolate reductase